MSVLGSRLSVGKILILLAILALAFGCFLFFSKLRQGRGRLDPEVVRQAMAAEDAAAARVRPEDPDLKLLDPALRERAKAEWAASQAPSPANEAALLDATRRCQALLGDLLVRNGPERYRELAAFFTVRTVAALQAALPQIAAAGSVQAFLDRLPPGSEARRDVEESYGSFLLGVAMTGGLVHLNGEADPDLPAYARAVVMYRLLEEAARVSGVQLPLTDAERRILLRWKVEKAALARTGARQQAYQELKRIEPDYEPAQGEIPRQ